MKIDLTSIDREQFNVNEHILNGELVYLVFPKHSGAKWTKENKVLRSSVWNSQGELISAGFPKFVNFGETPDIFPVPDSLKDSTVVEKVDGSLLIVSKYKDQLILRTRGTIDATQLDNGHELELFQEKFMPDLYRFMASDTVHKSFLFEWVSPTQKIILNYGEPDWYLVGAVYHDNYSLETQEVLDAWALKSDWKRPEAHTFSSVAELLTIVDKWKGKEGVCIYSNFGQSIHKVKSDWYKVLHRMKSEFSTFDNVIDTWLTIGKPDYQGFYDFILNKFDYELAEQMKGDISRLSDAYKEVKKIIDGIDRFVYGLQYLPTRREQAKRIQDSYGDTSRTRFAFKLLDKKELDGEDIRKLLWQVMKK